MENIVIVSLSNDNLEAIIDAEDAHRVLEYNWYGDECGSKIYVTRRFRHHRTLKKVYLHRYLMNAPQGTLVDHINGNGLDNRRSCNLRFATPLQNMANQGLNCANTSGYKGVTYHKAMDKWQAYISVDDRFKYLGVYRTVEEAARAYDAAALAMWGEFAHLNFRPQSIPGP